MKRKRFASPGVFAGSARGGPGGQKEVEPSSSGLKWSKEGSRVDVAATATFQRLFLFPRGAELDWTAAHLASFELNGVDNTQWHVGDRPDWSRLEDGQACVAVAPPLSPLHAWIALTQRHHRTRLECVTALFEALLETGCVQPAVLNGSKTDPRSTLSYALRTAERAKSRTSPELLAFRLLMATPGINATEKRDWDSPLRTALDEGHDSDVIVQILAAHRDPLVALLQTSASICVLLLQYPALSHAYLPELAMLDAKAMFQQDYSDAADFAGELVRLGDHILWRAVTLRVPADFVLPVRRYIPCETADDWEYHDALRSAISASTEHPHSHADVRLVERCLWLLQHSADDDLDAYDCGGHTLLMRVIVQGGELFTTLILALIKRAPAVDPTVRALVSAHDNPITPGILPLSDLTLGDTAREMLIAKWKPTGSQFVQVSVALEIAETQAKECAELATPILTILPFPPELRHLTAIFAQPARS
jgi:hypothetical protein